MRAMPQRTIGPRATRSMPSPRKIEEEAEFLAEHSDAAKAVVDFCRHWDREIKHRHRAT